VWVYVCVWATLPDLNKMEWNGKKRGSVSATDMLHFFYKTTIITVLEYACPAWHNSLNIEQSYRIESI